MIIQKMEKGRTLGRDRLVLKSFKTDQDAHAFLNKQYDNAWSVSRYTMKAGYYAFVGGTWQNVKNLPPELLSHV